MLCEGLSSKEVAPQVGISTLWVDSQCNNVMPSLQIAAFGDQVIYAVGRRAAGHDSVCDGHSVGVLARPVYADDKKADPSASLRAGNQSSAEANPPPIRRQIPGKKTKRPGIERFRGAFCVSGLPG
jgi:hypothetical protein